ncbi:MAG: hypothetical protein RLZZ126_9 [Pseudomonadota bacterium]
MLQIFLVTFPFFALVLAGYVAARTGWLPLQAIPGLNAFVLYFALPCMLFRFGATLPISQLLDPAAFVVYLVCAMVMVAFALTVSLNARIGWNDGALGALVAAFPNTGFMGVPLLVALLGQAAAGPAIVTILVDLVITSSLCIALSTLDGSGDHGAGHAVRNALVGVAKNPMPWAILAGALASASEWKPPGALWQTLGMLADAASPVALFTIGCVLARSQVLTREGHHPPIPWSDVLPMALAKLFLHPVLVLLAGSVAIQVGMPLSRFALTVMTLVAALPSASNVAMLAERFGADSGRIARIILMTTVAAFVSFSVAVRLLG